MSPLVKEWLHKADEDYRSAQILLRDSEPLVTPAMFHLQQNAEKLLKALLVKKEIIFERRHDLTYLLKQSEHEARQCADGESERFARRETEQGALWAGEGTTDAS